MRRVSESSARTAGLRRVFAWGALAAVCGLGWLLLPRPAVVHPLATCRARVVSAGRGRRHRYHRLVRAPVTGACARTSLRRAAPDAKSELIRPRPDVASRDRKIWRFTAERGEVSPDRENVYLSGPVHGRRGPARPLEVESRDVRIMVSKSYGESDGPSTIRGTGFETRGTGVRFWLEEDRVELLSDAHGVFRPQ